MIVTLDEKNLYIESIYGMRPDEINIEWKVGVSMIDVLKVLFVISPISLVFWFSFNAIFMMNQRINNYFCPSE